MHLEHLSLLNYKNVEQAQLTFGAGINALVGDNGAGKSNILDAIYYLSMSRSMISTSDAGSMRHGAEFFVLDGRYMSDEWRSEVVSCSYSTSRSASKVLKRNGKEYERLSDHMGLIPVVVVSPYDTSLISDSAEERRRFLNLLISQFDSSYLASLIRYNALLAQRNRLLKGGADEQMLTIYDEQIAPHATTIERIRRVTIEEMIPLVCHYYELLSGGRESVELEYRTQLSDGEFLDMMRSARQRDMVNGYSTIGVHRDDVIFRIEGHMLRKFGSQGQQKSFLVALKLAQYQLLSRHKGERAILLLDDLFDKLDRGRVEQLIHLVSGDDFGQIFISDCNQERLRMILDRAEREYTLLLVEGGEVSDID